MGQWGIMKVVKGKRYQPLLTTPGYENAEPSSVIAMIVRHSGCDPKEGDEILKQLQEKYVGGPYKRWLEMDSFVGAGADFNEAWKGLIQAIRDELGLGKKREALEIIKIIQSGGWNRNTPEPPKGTIAEDKWLDPDFSYGMEYGAIVALMQLFKLETKDLL